MPKTPAHFSRVAIRALAIPDFSCIALVGAGQMAHHLVPAFDQAFPKLERFEVATGGDAAQKTSPSTPTELPDHAAPSATKFCVACGKSIPRSAKFCPECGGAQG